MSWLLPSVIATLCATLILMATYFYLYSIDHQRFLAIWGAGWLVYALRFVFMLMVLCPYLSIGRSTATIANQLATLGSGLLLLLGTYDFAGRRMPLVWWGLAALIVPWIVFAGRGDLPFVALTLPTFFVLGLIYAWTGIVFLQYRQKGGRGALITGSIFILWGLHKFDYPFLRAVKWLAPWGYLLGAALALMVAIGMLLIYFAAAREE